MLCNRTLQKAAHALQRRVAPHPPQLERSLCSREDPAQTKIIKKKKKKDKAETLKKQNKNPGHI